MLQQAQAIKPQLVEWRRTLHRHPELGFEVHATAEYVASTLEHMGIRVRRKVGQSGVVGYLGQGKPSIAIRADMDALPIQEENQVEYASQIAGRMHACGHDAHTAILLGVARLLNDLQLSGEVRLLFQPSEETYDAQGVSGATRMIADGALDGVDAVIALHADATIEAGRVSVGEGWVAAAVDEFEADIIGKGGHGAYPHQTVDPIWLASHVLAALYAIPSRRVAPLQPCVVSVGIIRAGTAENIIPDRLYLKGTLRSFDDAVREQLIQEVERALSVTRALGGDYELNIQRGYPAMYNHPQVVAWLQQVARELLGADKVGSEQKTMGAEDFAYMTQLAKGAQLRLGVRAPGGPVRPLHTATFDIDESALPVGAAILAETARRFLNGELPG